MKRLFAILITVLLLAACRQGGPSGVAGTLLRGNEPLAQASVEIYLKADKDRSVQPFAVGSTDDEGRYRIDLPPGRYFIIGKKRTETADGRPLMLMAECPANPVQVDRGLLQVAPFGLREMGRDGQLVPEPGTGLDGRVVFEGAGVEHAFVYVYTDRELNSVGPGYGAAVETGSDGAFHLDLPSGTFWLAARKRADGSRFGVPRPGDLNASFGPVTLRSGERIDYGEIALKRVSEERYRQKQAEGHFADTGTALTGRLRDSEGTPVAGVRVFAYLDSRMVGKPVHISDPSGGDGRFRLNLVRGGTWYLGARSAFGGPLEPGEWVGTWEGNADHHVEVPDGQVLDLGDFEVREVW
ncbi:MAG: hypothetical protein Tsb0017_17700 [Geothermobacteraceae bacterium]